MMDLMGPASQGFTFDLDLLIFFKQLLKMGKIHIEVLFFDNSLNGSLYGIRYFVSRRFAAILIN